MMMLMLSCKKAAELIDKRSVVSLSMPERLQLSLHTRMCKVCSAYGKQSKVMDDFTRKMHSSQPAPRNLPEAARNKIIKALEEK